MKKKGFTLVELLVVIAIIGLLSTLAVVALNSARQKSRDAKRVADIKQVQTALELYFNDQGGYPVEAVAITLGDATHDCFDATGGFVADSACDATPYMGLVPSYPTPPAGSDYIYLAAASGAYSITFDIEGSVGSLTAGSVTADQTGMKN